MWGRKAIGTVAYMGGVPAVLEAFCWAWGQMVQHNQELLCEGSQYIHYDRAVISDHAPARNQLTARFLGDWLIQFDTDHTFDPDIVARLVRTADELEIDVMSGVYQMKSPPHVPVLYQWIDSGDGKAPLLQPMARWQADARVVQIGSAGGGCLFVRRSVFERMAEAYPGVGAFDKIHPFSEDHSFFARCRDLGIPCYAAMHIHSHHLRVTGVTLDDLDDTGIPVSALFPVGGFV